MIIKNGDLNVQRSKIYFYLFHIFLIKLLVLSLSYIFVMRDK